VIARLYRNLAAACSLVAIAVTLAIVIVLLKQSSQFFRATPLAEFLTGTEWSPGRNGGSFGVLPLLAGSVEIMVISAALAIPIATLSAVYLNEYAPPRLRLLVSVPLDLMAGIPAVVFGYMGLFLVTPWLRVLLPSIQASNALSASIVVAIMILPLITAVVQDALANVPTNLRESAYAVGCTKAEVVIGVVLPSCRSAIIAAFVLAMARAIGETMAITLAAGSTPNGSLNPLKSTETLTTYILTASQGDVSVGSLRYLSIFALGLLLFIVTYMASLLTNRLRSRSLFGFR
jgi:phosphate transport system permease protein